MSDTTKLNDVDALGLLTDWLRTSYSRSRVDAIIWYGSRRLDADLDLLVVTPSPSPLVHIELGRLDLLLCPQQELSFLLQYFDPLITEPLLTGSILAEEAGCAARALESLGASSTNPSTTRYLLRRSLEILLDGFAILETFDKSQEEGMLLRALTNLSFALSYREFALFYYDNPASGPVTFASLRAERKKSELEKTLGLLAKAKTGCLDTASDVEEVRTLFEETLIKQKERHQGAPAEKEAAG
jgi:hypothetical protein